jgi:hypothetical protein
LVLVQFPLYGLTGKSWSVKDTFAAKINIAVSSIEFCQCK